MAPVCWGSAAPAAPPPPSARFPGSSPRSRCQPPLGSPPLSLLTSSRAPASLSSMVVPRGPLPPSGPLRLSPACAPPPAHSVGERPRRRRRRPRLPGRRVERWGASVLRHHRAAAAAAPRGPPGSPGSRPRLLPPPPRPKAADPFPGLRRPQPRLVGGHPPGRRRGEERMGDFRDQDGDT